MHAGEEPVLDGMKAFLESRGAKYYQEAVGGKTEPEREPDA